MASLRIAETFSSIQGEGEWLGVPSFFIRISGCNLRCRWCDTPYASWTPEGPTLALEELAARAADLRHVVVTGGEPMLFDAVEELCRMLKAAGHVITIETAGTIHRRLPCDLMSVSPKLAHSTPDPATPGGWAQRHEAARLNLPVLAGLSRDYHHQFKFVVNPESGKDDLGEIESLLSQLDGLGEPVDPSRVFIMAEGVESEVLHRRERMLVEPCLQRGWRLTPRFHIDLFGDKRGT